MVWYTDSRVNTKDRCRASFETLAQHHVVAHMQSFPSSSLALCNLQCFSKHFT